MENKKQLVIIPPMSEALKKLNEVLQGITEDESVEISMIDDLKELTQFVASTGQCLILASNAKKCANFLQENKVILAKNHCKIILFTPKEIPAKTLVKFTKIGLTESILESSPPKTILYKIKLQLRSIKTVNSQENSEKLIKSLENNKRLVSENAELESKEKGSDDESITDHGMNKKKFSKDAEQSIDYSDPLKTKDHSEEESIETMWKTNRKKSIDLNLTEEKDPTIDSEATSIDMYYRGKKNKLDSMLEFDEDNLDISKKINLIDLEISSAKKNSYADVIEEGTIKEKRLEQHPSESQEDKKKTNAEIDLLLESQEHNNALEEIDSELNIDLKRRHQLHLDEESAKTRKKMSEDLGGYLKGKLAENSEIQKEDKNENDNNYDNSEIEKSSQKNIDLELLAAAEKLSKKSHDADLLNNTHEGKVDKIDNNMFGDSATVDKISSRMNGSIDKSKNNQDHQDEQLTSDHTKEKLSLDEIFPKKDKNLNNDLVDNEFKKDQSIELTEADEEELDIGKSKKEIEISNEDNQRSLDPTDDTSEQDRLKKVSLEIQLEKAANTNESGAEEEVENNSLKSRESSGILPKKQGRQIHEGHVDKIDNYYRNGDSKNKEQNWDNLTDKKSKTDSLQGLKKSGMTLLAAEEKNYDETTIDYRKLKEEFEQMAIGLSSLKEGAEKATAEKDLLIDEDQGSFKVIEITPLSLDFSIHIINSILTNETKPKKVFTMITDELIEKYNCFPVFYKYNPSDKKFSEVFNSFNEAQNIKILIEKKVWWNEFKNDTPLFEHFHKLSMTTWRCPEIVKNNEIWEDVELPSWAEQELVNKHTELIFPYFDGLDRMGLAIVIFPDGINPKTVNGLLTVLEMARTLFLDTIERYKIAPAKEVDSVIVETQKSSVSNFFNGLFGKKKAS